MIVIFQLIWFFVWKYGIHCCTTDEWMHFNWNNIWEFVRKHFVSHDDTILYCREANFVSKWDCFCLGASEREFPNAIFSNDFHNVAHTFLDCAKVQRLFWKCGTTFSGSRLDIMWPWNSIIISTNIILIPLSWGNSFKRLHRWLFVH